MSDSSIQLRHKIAYKVGRFISAIALIPYGYKHDKTPELPEPCLVLSNHTTEVDVCALFRSFPKQMYFVCGEHLLRTAMGSLFMRYFAPIPAPRGGATLSTVAAVMHRLREGHSVMMFPEGSRSFNGVTARVEDSIGKLIKKVGCGLVTYKLIGGYFIAPRWAYSTRKGKLEGKVVNYYPAEQLKALSPAEITDIINMDIYEDAYARQRSTPTPYYSKTGAEGLENYLIICPECGCYDTMESKGNTFRCTCCGTSGTYDAYGFLHGTEGKVLKFDNVRDWGKWIEKRFDEDMAERPENACLFTETGIRMYTVNSNTHTSEDIYTDAELKMYNDRLEIGDKVFLFADISKCSMLYFGKTWLFTHTDGYFGLTGEHFHAWKLDRLYKLSRR